MDGKLSDKEWVKKGNLHLETGELEDALRCFQTAINVNSKNAVAWFKKGLVLQKLEKFDDSLYCYDEALILDPSLTEADEKRIELKSFSKPKKREWKNKILMEIEATTIFRIMGVIFFFAAALSLIIFFFSFLYVYINWVSLVTFFLNILSGITWFAIARKFDAIVRYFEKFVLVKKDEGT